MSNSRFRVGFVGAGDICPVHVEAVQALPTTAAAAGLPAPDVEIIGVTDLDSSRAATIGSRYGIDVYDSLEALVKAGANVIHVLTPPHAHAPVACAAMELGCDVFIEKPLSEDLDDCERIAETAERTGRVATVDHLLLFDPGIEKAAAAVAAGKIGKVVGMDIIRGGELLPYEGGALPPHLRDAGFAYRDLAVHHFYLFQKFLGPIEDVKAEWMSLGGETAIAWDEWRTLVRCRDGLGQFQISLNAKPIQNQIILHGTKGVLRIDLFSLFQSTRSYLPLPRPAERLFNIGVESVSALVQAPLSVFKFATKKVQRLQGVRSHIAEFYRRLESGEPQVVSLADATELVRWNEVVARAAAAEYEARLAEFTLRPTADVLVTGASGEFGRRIVDRLVANGSNVRAMVRHVPNAPIDGVDYAIGNLGDPEFVDRAVAGVPLVIHCGAVVKGTEAEHKAGTIRGTQNVVDACLANGVEQLVYISSMSVIHSTGVEGEVVDEHSPTETRPDERGAYTSAKLAAEDVVRDAVESRNLAAVILRPGALIGGGAPLASLGGAMGGGASRFLVLGDGEVNVPLVDVDDAVDAVLDAVTQRLTGGEIIQIIDTQTWTQNQVLTALDPSKKIVHVPRNLVFRVGRATEPLFAKLGKQSPVAEYRLRSALSKMRYESDQAEKLLGWTPKVGAREGIARYAEELRNH